MPKYFTSSDISEANQILSGKAPEQSTAGSMTRAERIASVGRAFGAKAPEPKPSALEEAAKDLQMKLGSDVIVTPEKRMKKGGKISSASKRADGCCVKGKTRGKYL